MQYLKGLDGIRALSVSLVLVSHCGFGNIVPGGFGVTTFFFLSGFLITTLLQREFDRTSEINIRNFMLRRILRIFVPLYTVYLTLLFLSYMGFYPAEYTIGGVLSQLTFFANYYEILVGSSGLMDGTGTLWSLAVEEHFYVLYPAVFLFLVRRNINYLFLFSIFMILLVFLWRIYLAFNDASFDRIYLATDTRMDSIVFGVLLSIVMYQRNLFRETQKLSLNGLVIIVLAVITLFLTFIVRDDFFRKTLRYSLQGLALMPLFYYVITRANIWMFSWLNSQYLVKTGLYSYMIYLIHSPIIYYLGHIGLEEGLQMLLIAYALSFFISALSYRFIEKPVLSYKDRFKGS